MPKSRGAVAGLSLIKALVWIVYALATAAIIVLAFAFVLLLFDANPANAFAQLVTQWGSTFARPFIGLIQPTLLSNGGAVAWSLLFAIAAYAVAAWAIGALLDSVSRSLARARYEQSASSTPVAAPLEQRPASDAAAVPRPPAGGVVSHDAPAGAAAANPDSSVSGAGPAEAGPAAADAERREVELVGPNPGAGGSAKEPYQPS